MYPKLRKLFEPITIGRLELKNRIIMEPLGGLGYTANDRVTPRFKAFYEARARGGASLIVIRAGPLADLGQPGSFGVGLYGDDLIPGLRELVSVVHEGGAKIAVQIGIDHTWRRAGDSQPELVGPSPVALPRSAAPRELTATEIHEIVRQFGEGVRRAREAGFDAVEFHAYGSYLIAKFLSPYTNKRTDAYGGSSENRLRFLLEIIESVKTRAGEDFTLACRIGGEDFMEGGLVMEDVKQYAARLETAGIQLLDVGVGWGESGRPFLQMSVPRGAYVYLAEGVKKAVHVPVVASTRINDPVLAERILAEGRADMIGMARALIADPEFPNKAGAGRFYGIRPCIACCYCRDPRAEGQAMACSVNPRAGKEGEAAAAPAPTPKKVLVIGGGPAGLQAAATAAGRGHKVVLWEKGGRPGGQLLLASVAPHKDEIVSLSRYLIDQARTSGVKVSPGKTGTLEAVKKLKPDAVVVATGAVETMPSIPGLERESVVTALDVLGLRRWVGGRVLVMGGGRIGCEVAEFLAEKGKKVTITSRQERIGDSIGRTTRWVVMQRLARAGVRTETRIVPVEVTGQGVSFHRDGQDVFIEADTVVVAGGMAPENGLIEALRTAGFAVYPVGDCVEPRNIAEAIAAGYWAGCVV